MKSTGRERTSRRWERKSKEIGGRRVGCYTLQCKTPDCGATEDMIDRTTDGLPASMIQKKLEQKGWTVGADDRFDFCPRCTEAATIARRARKNKLTLVPSPATQPDEQMEEPMSKQDTPTETPAPVVVAMTREDRKIIHNRLTELYVDEATGYRVPWNDARVAEDLGASVEWIAEIRDQFFGPAVDNPILTEVSAEIGEFSASLDAYEDELRRFNAMSADLVKLGADLQNKHRALAGSQQELQAKFNRLMA